MPGKRTTLASVTSEAAVDLNPTTSVPWRRSWLLRGVSCLLARRSMATGAVAWRCTRSLGSELGRDFFLFPHLFFQNNGSLVKRLIPFCRARRDYWEKLKPASGRPFCPSMSKPDSWGVTKGHADLMQQKEATSQEQLKALFEKANKGQWATHLFVEAKRCSRQSLFKFTYQTIEMLKFSVPWDHF